MDSITQIALGAAVGHAVLGRRVGYRAALWGAACGTLPDLDVFITMGGPVADFTYHRSFSHSLLILPLLVPVISWLILKLHPTTRDHRRGWYGLVLLVLLTHPLLDSFTIYGTQLFWPLSEIPIGLGSIFIIDPLYTLPLLAGLIGAWALHRQPRHAQWANRAGLLVSTLYLGWSVLIQNHVATLAEKTLTTGHPPTERLLVTPAPFNTLLWRIVAMTDEGYLEGYHSLLDHDRKIRFTAYRSDTSLLEGLQDHWPVQRLQWFTRGFHKVEEQQGNVILSDLRMGAEPDYVFAFKVGTIGNPHPKPAPDERIITSRDWGRVAELMRRIRVEPEP